jgi:putative FmdB family regulatory protein
MPTYDFRCETCGHEFELMTSIAERDRKAVCPNCGSRHVKTVIRAFAIGLPRKPGGSLSATPP